MTVNEMIKLLAQLPGDTFHNLYCGGGDDQRFDEPAVRLDINLRTVYILPDTLEYQIQSHTCLIEDLL